MATVHCSKCGQDREGLANPPFGGELAKQVHQRICKTCWTEWIGRQTMIINEYRLNFLEPEHRARQSAERDSDQSAAPDPISGLATVPPNLT